MKPNVPSTAAPDQRSTLMIMFVVLVVDLAGFSVIFPLYPRMLEFYIETGGEAGAMGWILAAIRAVSAWAGASQAHETVLFGGILGSLYSLLQFVCAPLFGSLSDRFGRRPVLVVSTAGIAFSYILWIVAGRFEVLVLSRLLGGVMAANISTATAVVADVTPPGQRAKGMAVVGAAVGIGFILGPVIGGLGALWDWSAAYPAAAAYGVNPFSAAAAAALALALFNFAWVSLRFRETHQPGAADPSIQRTVNPIRLFHTEGYPGVTRTNWTYFLYLVAFSGMEFSLVFLCAERFDYGPMDIALVMVFTGVVLAGAQGGYVRRRSAVIGPARMNLHGLVLTIVGLAIIGVTPNSILLYAGLFVLAVGAAMVMPCLSALASLYAPAEEQGRVLGVFRSLGALARALGPLAACVAFWRLGSMAAYLGAAAFIVLPLLLARTLPPVDTSSPEPEAAGG